MTTAIRQAKNNLTLRFTGNHPLETNLFSLA